MNKQNLALSYTEVPGAFEGQRRGSGGGGGGAFQGKEEQLDKEKMGEARHSEGLGSATFPSSVPLGLSILICGMEGLMSTLQVGTRMSGQYIKRLHGVGPQAVITHSPPPEALGSDTCGFSELSRCQKGHVVHRLPLQNTPAGSGAAPSIKHSEVSVVKCMSSKRHNKDFK